MIATASRRGGVERTPPLRGTGFQSVPGTL